MWVAVAFKSFRTRIRNLGANMAVADRAQFSPTGKIHAFLPFLL